MEPKTAEQISALLKRICEEPLIVAGDYFGDEAMRAFFDLPEHMLPGLVRYLVFGIAPGKFLQAALKNDLLGAASRADDENRAVLWRWPIALYNGAPSPAWGSAMAYNAWVAKGGHLGIERANR
jgi:hypothetical protein